MALNISAKIIITITGVITFALVLTVMLNYVKFERTFSDLVESRLTFMVEDIWMAIATGVDLGLELSTITNVQAILEWE